MSLLRFSEVAYAPAAVGSVSAGVSLKEGFPGRGVCPTAKWCVASAQEAERRFLQACGLQCADQEGCGASWDNVSGRYERISAH